MAKKLDNNFIKRATKVTSFNLSPADFQSLTHKNEIQHLYRQYMFGSFDPSLALKQLTKGGYNRLINLLKSDDSVQYEKLHNLKLSGVGPGEAALYLLTQTGQLGGGSSAGVDLIVGSKQYEVKAVKWKSATKDFVHDFKLGGNIPGMTQLEAEIQNAFFEAKITVTKGQPEIAESLFKKFKQLNPKAYNQFEKKYQKLSMQYFSGHEVVFIQTDKAKPDFGEIIAIKKVKAEDIRIERYTSRTLKPLIKI